MTLNLCVSFESFETGINVLYSNIVELLLRYNNFFISILMHYIMLIWLYLNKYNMHWLRTQRVTWISRFSSIFSFMQTQHWHNTKQLQREYHHPGSRSNNNKHTTTKRLNNNNNKNNNTHDTYTTRNEYFFILWNFNFYMHIVQFILNQMLHVTICISFNQVSVFF